MNASALQQAIPRRPVWRMPIHPERYDRGPLSDAERMALTTLVSGDARLNTPARRRAEATLIRLTRPLHDVYGLRRTDASVRPTATRVMCTQMHRRGKAFWHWSAQEWCDVVGATAELWDGKTSVVLRLPARRRGEARSTRDAIGQCRRWDALSAEGSAIQASDAAAPGCSTARTRSASTADAARPAP